MRSRPPPIHLLLRLSCLILLAATLVNFASANRSIGNLVVIHVDDLGWRDLGIMGSPVYETPHIDALAESGTLDDYW
jgi:hypothetical protein